MNKERVLSVFKVEFEIICKSSTYTEKIFAMKRVLAGICQYLCRTNESKLIILISMLEKTEHLTNDRHLGPFMHSIKNCRNSREYDSYIPNDESQLILFQMFNQILIWFSKTQQNDIKLNNIITEKINDFKKMLENAGKSNGSSSKEELFISNLLLSTFHFKQDVPQLATIDYTSFIRKKQDDIIYWEKIFERIDKKVNPTIPSEVNHGSLTVFTESPLFSRIFDSNHFVKITDATELSYLGLKRNTLVNWTVWNKEQDEHRRWVFSPQEKLEYNLNILLFDCLFNSNVIFIDGTSLGTLFEAYWIYGNDKNRFVIFTKKSFILMNIINIEVLPDINEIEKLYYSALNTKSSSFLFLQNIIFFKTKATSVLFESNIKMIPTIKDSLCCYSEENTEYGYFTTKLYYCWDSLTYHTEYLSDACDIIPTYLDSKNFNFLNDKTLRPFKDKVDFIIANIIESNYNVEYLSRVESEIRTIICNDIDYNFFSVATYQTNNNTEYYFKYLHFGENEVNAIVMLLVEFNKLQNRYSGEFQLKLKEHIDLYKEYFS